MDKPMLLKPMEKKDDSHVINVIYAFIVSRIDMSHVRHHVTHIIESRYKSEYVM